MVRSSPKLSVVTGYGSTIRGSRAPEHLTGIGLQLWQDVTELYEFDDPGSYQILAHACDATNRAEAIRKLIDKDGEIVRGRPHPLLGAEMKARDLCARLLHRLGLDLEPIKPIGRPPGGRASQHMRDRRKL